MRKNITIRIDEEIIDKVKDIVYWEPGMSMSDLFEQSIKVMIKELQDKHGKKYEKRPKNIKCGRRPS